MKTLESYERHLLVCVSFNCCLPTLDIRPRMALLPRCHPAICPDSLLIMKDHFISRVSGVVVFAVLAGVQEGIRKNPLTIRQQISNHIKEQQDANSFTNNC